MTVDTARSPRTVPDLPGEEFTWRIGRLTAAMAENGFDELLVYGWPWRPDNVRYVTGAPTTGGASSVRVTSTGQVSALVWSRGDWAAIVRAGWVDDVTYAPGLSGADLAALLAGLDVGARVGVTHLELMPVRLRQAIS